MVGCLWRSQPVLKISTLNCSVYLIVNVVVTNKKFCGDGVCKTLKTIENKLTCYETRKQNTSDAYLLTKSILLSEFLSRLCTSCRVSVFLQRLNATPS